MLDMLNYIDRHVEAFGSYESAQSAFFISLLAKHEAKAFLDIGANWGYYSLLVSIDNRFKDIKIYSFEPDKINRSQLYANIFLNKISDRIVVFDKGVSNKSGTVGFNSYGAENRGRSSISENSSATIEICTIDDTFSFKNQVIGIKIDIEGHKLYALEGMSKLLHENKCIIQVEAFGENGNQVNNFLEKHSYARVNSIGSDHFFIKNNP